MTSNVTPGKNNSEKRSAKTGQRKKKKEGKVIGLVLVFQHAFENHAIKTPAAKTAGKCTDPPGQIKFKMNAGKLGSNITSSANP